MAIDRDTAYYKEWRNERNWKLRFEIIPAGKFVDSAHNYQTLAWVAMKRGIINVKSQKASFDKLPIGVMDAPSISVEFETSDLHPNLIAMLKKPFFDQGGEGLVATTTNLFVLKSDRGTGTISFIEFVGGQKNTLSNSFGIGKDGATFTARTVTIDAIDVFKLVLEQVPTSWFSTNIIDRGIAAETFYKPTRASGRMLDFAVLDLAARRIAKNDYQVDNVDVYSSLDVRSAAVYMYQPIFMFTYGLKSAIQKYLAAWTRSGNPTTYNIDLNRTPFIALTTFKGATVASTNARGATLSDTEMFVIGKTTHWADETVIYGGMLIEDKDDESYQAYPYMWDLMKNVCEGSCSKMTYKPKLVANTTGAVMDLSYEISFDKIFQNTSGTRQDLSARFADAHGDKDFSLIPCSGVITSATAEIPNEGGTDSNSYEARIVGVMSDVRINAQMVHHNSATGDGVTIGYNDTAAETRLHPRKLYYALGSGGGIDGIGFQKIHESVKIHDGITETTYDNPLAIEYSGTLEWIVGYATQSQLQSGLPYAVANFFLSRFSDETQNEIKVTMFMVDGETMPENIGDTVTIPTFADFDCSTIATIIEIEANWQAGTVDLTLLTRGV